MMILVRKEMIVAVHNLSSAHNAAINTRPIDSFSGMVGLVELLAARRLKVSQVFVQNHEGAPYGCGPDWIPAVVRKFSENGGAQTVRPAAFLIRGPPLLAKKDATPKAECISLVPLASGRAIILQKTNKVLSW
jgi:hypothetical protein